MQKFYDLILVLVLLLSFSDREWIVSCVAFECRCVLKINDLNVLATIGKNHQRSQMSALGWIINHISYQYPLHHESRINFNKNFLNIFLKILFCLLITTHLHKIFPFIFIYIKCKEMNLIEKSYTYKNCSLFFIYWTLYLCCIDCRYWGWLLREIENAKYLRLGCWWGFVPPKDEFVEAVTPKDIRAISSHHREIWYFS